MIAIFMYIYINRTKQSLFDLCIKQTFAVQLYMHKADRVAANCSLGNQVDNTMLLYNHRHTYADVT